MLGNDRHKAMRLDDGEVVVRLRGGRRGKNGYPSNRPHAGIWGKGTAYALVPGTTGSVNRRVAQALEFDPGLVNRSSDVEVLLLGSEAQIGRLLASGPKFCRGLVRRQGDPAASERLAQFRFSTAANRSASAPE